ncbi:MAG: bifunctional glutamate N-acetyltransferase/amino-acid acetyltransferase ArgJ [Anaerolineae bacterium]|nr:bifunctional glutamate N-acetyltransferase/amino-acid acetyltransferase ArgJ [Thermoflexales bacterium]MDW8407982.1 bifunctional glutamate N-acetyltransferase/amino-acid acetyltransferase ArgJ [Anaerolineae bacterium]
MSGNSTVASHLPRGFQAAGVAAGIKKTGAPDLALIVSERDCVAAATFTTNVVQAAPVVRGKSQLASPRATIRAVVINSGCANACTGTAGLADAEETARLVAEALVRQHPSDNAWRITAEQVFTMSTGVIGVPLPMDKLRAGIPAAAQQLSPQGLNEVARAIMTTDTRPKIASIDRGAWRIAGIAKGAGMIHPNMATLLSCILTDAAVEPALLREFLHQAVAVSFNRIVIDGDTSTNDTVLLLANGAGGIAIETPGQRNTFQQALNDVCVNLAQQVVRDGEGVTKFITLRITGAHDEHMADQVGRSIARSPLVKTAFYGEDANWGRVIAAAGYSGAAVDPNKMTLWFGPVKTFEAGEPTDYDEADASAAMKSDEIEVRLDLGLGEAETVLWTCDLSHEYVTINGKYRT